MICKLCMCHCLWKIREDGSDNTQWTNDGEITNPKLIKEADKVRDGDTNTCTNWNYHYLIAKRILRDNNGRWEGRVKRNDRTTTNTSS